MTQRRPPFAFLTLALTAALAGCPPDESLRLVDSDLAGAILSVRSTGPDDTWFCGADGGDGPAAQGFDGATWTLLDTSDFVGADLWWVYPGTDVVVFVGSEGLIVEYDRASGALVEAGRADPAVTFFGVWGPSDDDLWAVGGDITGGLPPALWRRDAAGWAAWDPGVGDVGDVWFKVHGSSADDRWIVGNRGLSLHWDGAALTEVDTGATAPLLTVDVASGSPVAVGGSGSALILHRESGAWQERSPEFQPSVNGVCGAPGGGLRAVGGRGSLHRYADGAWESDLDTLVDLDYHACFFGDDGRFWGVGGAISSVPLTDGFIAYEGAGDIPSP